LFSFIDDITSHGPGKILKWFLIHLDNAGLPSSGMSHECIEARGRSQYDIRSTAEILFSVSFSLDRSKETARLRW
jgi:hypothetical protein